MCTRIKKFNFFLLVALLIVSCTSKNIPNEIVLQNWEFRAYGESWMPAKVPGFVHLDLYDNNLIEDPFYSANENKSDWIATTVWEYQSTFSLDAAFLKKQNIALHFSGIDTYAEVFLNDSLIQTCSNFFVSHQVNLTSLLALNNKIRFVFKPTSAKAKELEAAAPYLLPGAERVQVRKPQFHFGWDWGPKLLGCGITEEVKLIASNKSKFSQVHISTLSANNALAQLSLELEISNWDTSVHSISFLDTIIALKQAKSSFEFTIANPKLWNAIGYGSQDFTSIKLSLLKEDGSVIEELEERFAIRTIELVQEEDELGKGFKFRLNGKDLFAKGANWIPLDFFHTRIDSNAYRKALLDAADANMNMLRVWGGGIYEDDYFYDLCDSLGILVWQDFMFACAMYPGSDAFMESVALEATQQIKRLRKHPSIALWCGNNENSEGWHRWAWQDHRSQEEIDSIWTDYQNLFNKLLPNLVHSLSNTAYWESSPQYGRGNPKHQHTGDAHYWGVWHDAEPFENFQTKVPRFMSEYGFQSFPEMDALELFVLEEDMYMDSEVMKTHQKHPRGNNLIKEYMARDYKTPADFESFVYLSQILQADGMRMGIEAHRRARPYNMGTLYWQFNDCWPAVSWSGRDYYGNWKALHYTAKRSYQDLIISSRQTKDSVFTYVINDTHQDQIYDLSIDHIDYSGARLGSNAKLITVKGASSTLVYSKSLEDYLYIDSLKNQSYLDIQILKSGEVKARKLHHFVKTKDMDLPYTGISYKVEKDSIGFVVELFSDAFMKNVFLNSLHDGRFEDNYFDLPANEHKRIRFYNDYPMDEFNTNNLSFFSMVDTY